MKNRSFSKAVRTFAILGAVIFLGHLSGAVLAYDGEHDRTEEQCYPIDLRSGDVTPLPPPYLEYVVPPEDFNGDGWHETVLKITLNDPYLWFAPEAVRFVIAYENTPRGITVNIGDSSSNDSGSGDAAEQSNDAELQIGGVLEEERSRFDDLSVFGHDGTEEARGTAEISRVLNIVKAGELIVLTVSNERLAYDNPDASVSGTIQSSWLYALDGQPDTEGPVNYDIFAAFNRVIASNDRSGSGVSEVTVCLVSRLKDRDRDDHDKR